MEIIKKYKIRIAIGALILLGLIASLLIFNKLNTDKMNNNKIYNVKYKVYQNGKWSRNKKNGLTVGDKENSIQNLEIKIKTDKGYAYYTAYTTDWSEQNYKAMEKNSKQIYGFKMKVSNLLHKKYDMCYRTYNKKDKWLNWTCNGEISGNSEEPITALEIKIIPKNSVKFDYLRDFNKTLDSSKNF